MRTMAGTGMALFDYSDMRVYCNRRWMMMTREAAIRFLLELVTTRPDEGHAQDALPVLPALKLIWEEEIGLMTTLRFLKVPNSRMLLRSGVEIGGEGAFRVVGSEPVFVRSGWAVFGCRSCGG